MQTLWFLLGNHSWPVYSYMFTEEFRPDLFGEHVDVSQQRTETTHAVWTVFMSMSEATLTQKSEKEKIYLCHLVIIWKFPPL